MERRLHTRHRARTTVYISVAGRKSLCKAVNLSATGVFIETSNLGLRKGQHVDQGMRIGAVGATGWATGPHLHFEFKLRGQQQDPLVIAKTSEAVVLSPESRAQFASIAQQMRSQLQAAGTQASTLAYVE